MTVTTTVTACMTKLRYLRASASCLCSCLSCFTLLLWHPRYVLHDDGFFTCTGPLFQMRSKPPT